MLRFAPISMDCWIGEWLYYNFALYFKELKMPKPGFSFIGFSFVHVCIVVTVVLHFCVVTWLQFDVV